MSWLSVDWAGQVPAESAFQCSQLETEVKYWNTSCRISSLSTMLLVVIVNFAHTLKLILDERPWSDVQCAKIQFRKAQSTTSNIWCQNKMY